MNVITKSKSLLTDWLSGMVFVSFEFSTCFRLRFERLENDSVNKPLVLHLEIKSITFVGDSEKWKDFVNSLPMGARRSERADPALAYRFMLLIGTKVNSVQLSVDGTLQIGTDDDETLTVLGKDDVWEESWIISEPDDLPDYEGRFVMCTSDGELFSS